MYGQDQRFKKKMSICIAINCSYTRVLGATGQGWDHAFPGHIPTSRSGSMPLPPARVHRAPGSHTSQGRWVTLSPKFTPLLVFYSTCSCTILEKIFLGILPAGWVAEDRCKRSQYNSAQKANAQRTVYQVTRFHSPWKSWQVRHTQLQVPHQLG